MTQQEFKELFENHFAQVRNYVFYRSGNTDISTDIAQEIFLKIWEKQNSIQSDKINVTEDGQQMNQDYKRLDTALVYKFRPAKVKAELGISIMNVLNTDNIKYSSLCNPTVDEVNLEGFYADAVPFTPALFFNIEF